MIPLIGVSIWSIAKICVLIALVVYIVFSIVVVRQVHLMTDTLEVGFESEVRTLSFIHLFIAIGIFVLALIIL